LSQGDYCGLPALAKPERDERRRGDHHGSAGEVIKHHVLPFQFDRRPTHEVVDICSDKDFRLHRQCRLKCVAIVADVIEQPRTFGPSGEWAGGATAIANRLNQHGCRRTAPALSRRQKIRHQNVGIRCKLEDLSLRHVRQSQSAPASMLVSSSRALLAATGPSA
jgi:hypothetical protein